ncbi:MAG: sulfite exporter TauE/SafE family protein [Polyangiaceae bacterium]
MNLNKHTFRATLTAVWLTLNSVLLVRFVSSGRIDAEVLRSLPWLVPAVPAGIFLGEKLHAKIDEQRFQLAVYGLLVVAALVLLVR